MFYEVSLHFTLFCINLILAGGTFANGITPVQNEMFLPEGANTNITLSCKYSSAYTAVA